MVKQRLLFITGILVALLPYSGFLASWKTAFFVFFGLFTTLLSYLLYREKKASLPKKDRGHDTFADNRGSTSYGVMSEIKSPINPTE